VTNFPSDGDGNHGQISGQIGQARLEEAAQDNFGPRGGRRSRLSGLTTGFLLAPGRFARCDADSTHTKSGIEAISLLMVSFLA